MNLTVTPIHRWLREYEPGRGYRWRRRVVRYCYAWAGLHALDLATCGSAPRTIDRPTPLRRLAWWLGWPTRETAHG